MRILALALAPIAVALLVLPAQAQDRPAQSTVDAYVKATFGKASPEWQARIAPDETLAMCNLHRNEVPGPVADAILARELARVKFPADSVWLGDWQRGYRVANNGRGGQFSDPPGTVAGGNCFACHQMDPKELSYGTLGPSLAGYGRDRKYAAEEIRLAWIKIYNAQAAVPCSNMPRFGSNAVLNEQQIKDVLAYLFDPESPVNK